MGKANRSFELVVKADMEWSYDREFLYPDEERYRWIKDHRVVRRLEEHGIKLGRSDSVMVHDIHELTETLVDLAEQHGGTYDGWECQVLDGGA